MLRAAILSHDALLRDSLASLLQLRAGSELVLQEADPRAAITAAREQQIQLLVVDTHALSAAEIQFLLGVAARGDLLVVFVGDTHLESQGAEHVVDRNRPADDLLLKIEELRPRIRPSRTLVREGSKTYGASDDGMLSRREYEVANLVARGMSNRRISQSTGLREQSVKNLVSVVMRKLGCENRVQVALKLVSAPVAPH